MAQTKIKAGLFEGIIGNGTDGYFLMSNGDGTMTWSSVIINPTITDVDYPSTATAADPAGGETITLTGTGFKTGATVTVGGTSAPSVSYVSETQITFTTPAKAAGDYDIVVTNTDTGSATFINGISFNGIPTWTTAAGSLGTFASNTTISTITLQATEPDAGTITFNITNGALPTGLSLTGANIDGTTSILNADTLYTFTVTATDDENQATPRTFTITVKKEFISSENFTINTYTGNGSTQAIEGKIGTAAVFNGVNPNGSVIDLPDLKPFFTQKQTVSLSMWFNAEVVTTDNTYLFSDYNSTSYNIFAYLNTSGILVVSNRMNGTTNNFISSSAYNDSQWYHLVITNDATSRVVTVYINGSSIGTTNISANSWSTGSLGKLGIGAFYSTSNSRWQQSLKGKIDQVRIFDKILSSSEVTTLYGESNTSTTKSTTDIFADGSGVALYEFEKGAIDTGGTNGYIGRAGVFDGSGYIDVSNSSSLVANKSAISISTWVMFDNLNTQNFIFWNLESGGANLNFGFYDYGNGSIYFQPDATTSTKRGYISNSGLYSANEWVHIVMVFDGSATGNANRLKAYINNSQVTLTFDGTISTTTGAADADIRLGGRTQSKLNGKLDQIRVFDKAISSSEVATLYGETSSSSTKSTTDIFGDGSGIALYELEGNANDTGGTYNGTATNVSYAYDGTPTDVSFVGTSFQPDFVWIKKRANDAKSHRLFDSVRGATKVIYSDLTNAEATATTELTSFDTNGFTVGSASAVNDGSSADSFVAWCWKVGGAEVSNTDGSITSTVRANQDAGFSICKFTAPNSSNTNFTWGHGLSTTPDLIISKVTSTTGSWYVWHKDLSNTATDYLRLNSADASNSFADMWGTGQTSTVGSMRTDASSYANQAHVAYCFHSVTGYQSVGAYEGNGSTTGPIVTTGFKPRFLLIKNIDTTAKNWRVMDSVRDARTNIQIYLTVNASGVEGTGTDRVIFTDTGFQLLTTATSFNASGDTFIYLAIA